MLMSQFFKATCDRCGSDTIQRIRRLRITGTAFGFQCPACMDVIFRAVNESWVDRMRSRGARAPLTETEVRSFMSRLAEDLLVKVLEREGMQA